MQNLASMLLIKSQCIGQKKKYPRHVPEGFSRNQDGREYILDNRSVSKGYPVQKQYIDDIIKKGKAIDSVWNIPMIVSTSSERTGYPTQKPLTLYERIIKASSNEGDIVLDPFAGCATTCVAAERLKRQWVGIDIWDKVKEVIIDRVEKKD